jgi:hypothetical protein
MPRFRSLFPALVLLIVTAASAMAANRLALVIGNDAYQNVDRLQKAVNDARAVAASLRRIGFTVALGENVARRDFVRSIAEFESRIRPGDVVFFFYAGHGVEIEGANYLMPIDVPKVAPGQQSVLKDEAVSTDGLIQRLQARGARSQIIVLDACRENPFKDATGRSIGASRGLGRTLASNGVFIMYSAGIGQVALDRLSDNDANPNSVFTRTLAPLLEDPNLSLVRVAKEMRVKVAGLAGTVGHLQTPAYYDEIEGDLFLARRDGSAAPQPPPVIAPPPIAAPAPAPAPPVLPPVARLDPAPAPAAPPPPVARDAGFIFPDSDRRILSRQEVERLSLEARRVARNEIYARRGRHFRDASLRAYFSRFSWYRPHSWEVRLTAIEDANVRLIQSMER